MTYEDRANSHLRMLREENDKGHATAIFCAVQGITIICNALLSIAKAIESK